jgi:hypothetical protein
MSSIKILIISVVYALYCETSFSRSPAVEPFVEIEIETKANQKINPNDPAIYFNFESTTLSKNSRNDSPLNSFHIFLMLGIALPVVSWVLVWNNMRTRAQKENAPNVQTLSNYKLNREKKKSEEEQIKKAS